jgi:DNA-binding IclR family transcriptional regulator
MDMPEFRSGTQSISRAFVVINEITRRYHVGLTLAELVTRTGFSRPTLHRILQCLVSEEILRQDMRSKRYFLGARLYEIGLAATPRINLRDACRPALERLAVASEDTVFLTIRRGFDSLVIDRHVGVFPVKTLTADIGTHRPLGTTAGGLALLMSLPPSEQNFIIQHNSKRYVGYGLTSETVVRKMLSQSNEVGYALNVNDVLPEVIAIGQNFTVPPLGTAAISIAAISSRMDLARREELIRAIRQQIDDIRRSIVAGEELDVA